MTLETHATTDRLTYPVKAVAGILGISRSLAYELVRRGDIPSLKLGRRVVVPRAALLEMVDSGRPPAVAAHDPAAPPDR